MEPVFCLVADLLGFRALIDNVEASSQSGAVDSWVELVDQSCRALDIERYQLISDSIFVVTEQTFDGLAQLVELSRTLLVGCLELDLSLRGAISKGDARWSDRLAHGAAIVSAYELGERSQWIGVCCQFQFPELGRLWGWSSVVSYRVPLRNGLHGIYPAVVWNSPPLQVLQERLLRYVEGPPSPGVTSKISNTNDFRNYLSRFTDDGRDPRDFFG